MAHCCSRQSWHTYLTLRCQLQHATAVGQKALHYGKYRLYVLLYRKVKEWIKLSQFIQFIRSPLADKPQKGREGSLKLRNLWEIVFKYRHALLNIAAERGDKTSLHPINWKIVEVCVGLQYKHKLVMLDDDTNPRLKSQICTAFGNIWPSMAHYVISVHLLFCLQRL